MSRRCAFFAVHRIALCMMSVATGLVVEIVMLGVFVKGMTLLVVAV